MLVVAALAAALIGQGPLSSRAAGAPRTRSIDTGLTLAPGHAGTLYAVRGERYGTVGRFVVSCSRTGLAETSYVMTKQSPDTLAGVDGRASARGAKLVGASRTLHGGVAPSGVEHWIVRTGGEPESIAVDASLLAISARAARGYCEFGLYGSLLIEVH